jgi:hypothetical protein
MIPYHPTEEEKKRIAQIKLAQSLKRDEIERASTPEDLMIALNKTLYSFMSSMDKVKSMFHSDKFNR